MIEIEKCKILKVNIAVTNMAQVIAYMKENMKNLRGQYFCVSNVHTTVMSYEDESYLNVQNSAALALPDGRPLSVVSQKRGYKEAQRVTGPDLMLECFKLSLGQQNQGEKQWKHFFYGSTQETLDILQEKLHEKYPDLQIAGMYSPPFRPLSEKEDADVIEMINDSEADIVWVGLGAPKQENWMYDHKDKINALMIGVGAGFDYHADKIKRAPKWMQKCSLEWLYRLFQDPKRLWKRYLGTNFKFMWWIFTGK